MPHNSEMYIRSVSQKYKKTGQIYTTYRLVESYRNDQGKVRQQVLLNLGCHFNITKAHWKLLADRVEDICRGQQTLFPIDGELEKEAQRIAKLIIQKFSEIHDQRSRKNSSEIKTDYQNIDVNSLEHRDLRKVGAEHVGYQAACQLQLDTVLKSLGFNQKQCHIALASIIGRLVHPGSELSTHRYLTEQSALDELIGTDFSRLSLNQFYEIADQLLKHKKQIEEKLYNREKDLFNLDESITLFDLTNTYFEGRCLANEKAQYGRSKEKRSDCCLVALGLVLDASGFPKKSEIFPGNVSEPKTLQQLIATLEGDKNTTIIMDAGIATEENVQWLKSSGYHYIVVSRKQNLTMPEGDQVVTVKEEKNNTVTTALVKNEETNELELYCHSQAKEEKSKQMLTKAMTRYETELKKLAGGLVKKGTVKKYEKVMERLGRLKEKYKKVGRLFQVIVTPDKDNKYATQITWKQEIERTQAKQAGVYCLRTNHDDFDEQTLWKTYTMLTEIETAFCSLKSELGFRPVYHQKEDRIDAHLLISIIAYHLLHTIRYQLKLKGIHHSWQTLRQLLDTQCRITTTLQLKNGKVVQVRKTSTPDPNQLMIYKALEIETHPGKSEKTYL